LEEQKKSGDVVTLSFSLLISTKPNVVRYSTSGTVILEGKTTDVKKKLEVNPKTKIPQILFTVYQHVFNSIFMLSSILKTPYPPPDLLHPMAEKIQILQTTPQLRTDGNETETGQSVQEGVASANAPSSAPVADKQK
jgi:hypothetical protein